MADQKTTEVTELTTVADGDILYIVDDPSGTPISKKITRANLLSSAAITGQITIDQSSATGAAPPLLLDQADVSEEMIEFTSTVGVGNAIEAVGAKTLTTTHFIKVTITGVGQVYIPAGTIA